MGAALKHKLELTRWWPIDIGVVLTQTEHKMTGRWPIDIGVAPKTQTKLKLTGKWPIDIGAVPTRKLIDTKGDKNMADRYGCDPKTQTQTDKMMTNRYRCGPKNSSWHEKWLIDIGTVSKTQTDMEMIGRWPIDTGAAPKTQTNTTNDWSIYVRSRLKNSNSKW